MIMETRKNNLPERETRVFDLPVEVEIREEGKSRLVTGYAAVFDQLSRNLGWFREKIDRKAFDNVLDQDVLALFNHDYNQVLARTISKTLTLEVDERGLKYSFEAPNTTLGNDLVEMLRRGDVQHSSFSFTTEEDKWEEDEEQGEIRTVLKVKRLWDVAPVTQPAYLQTEVSIAQRSYENWKAEKEKQEKEKTFNDLDLLEAELELLKIK